jgi:hypothetical protein
MLICLTAIFGTTSASAQKLTTNMIACNESAQARYECYIKVQKDSQAIAEKRSSSLKSQKKLRQSLYLKKTNETSVKSKAIAEKKISSLNSRKKLSQSLYLKNINETLVKSKEIAEKRRSSVESQKKLNLSLYTNLKDKLEESKAIAATRKSILDSQKQIRQEAYFKERQGSMENAKELGATRKAILEEKEKLRLELSKNIGKQLEKEHQEIMQQVEYSRSRNISHKGEKYSITYGYVPEPSP